MSALRRAYEIMAECGDAEVAEKGRAELARMDAAKRARSGTP